MGIVNSISAINGKVFDGISALTELSSIDLQEFDSIRTEYLKQLHQMSQTNAISVVSKLISNIGVDVYQSYLPLLDKEMEGGKIYNAVDFDYKNYNEKWRIRYFEITKWVNDKEENSVEKLANIYQALNSEQCNIALIYNRKIDGCHIYVVVANNECGGDPSVANGQISRVINAFKGNFPGVEISNEVSCGVPCCLNYYDNKSASVAIVSNLPSEKSENFISQNMEKLLDGVVPTEENDEYSIVLLASPAKDLDVQKTYIFENYTALSPYASWQKNFSFTNNKGETATSTVGLELEPMQGNMGLNMSKAATTSLQIGMTEGVVQNYTNYVAKHTIDLLEEQMKRLEQFSALGMWNFAAYFISNDYITTKNIANMYLALTEGEKSYMSTTAVNTWKCTDINTKVILKNLLKLQHPIFKMKERFSKPQEWEMYPKVVSATLRLSGKELAYSLNFPRKSICGIPVLDSVAFGREVQRFTFNDGDDICIGRVYHMRKSENTPVKLSKNSLASHAFITGSTGTGKSNAIYQLLSKLKNEGVKFLVVEPAKGEYKNVFGDVKVYGTNTAIVSELLRLNPFSFPKGIHVLEHIDRLVEIFNACWPMYAAMPAVLKDAVERVYINRGWNLEQSFSVTNEYPTLLDLLEVLPDLLNESMYSADTKSDYMGALVTRVKSLTNGINGQIFCGSRELSDEDLFENNVIVDISRVGSMETKSLLMGILMMKLQEYRLSNGDGEKANQELKHITVLEEAHNLLRKTSGLQSQESANLQGKSVEMLTNAIAEMRTYGEGFIIADQAPDLLDEAVIRNTNTKIVFRLPDEKDRVLVGKSAALTDNQIVELAKLPLSVASVYQNDWVEAVLCYFEEYTDKKKYEYKELDKDTAIKKFLHNIFCSNVEKLDDDEISRVEEWISLLKYSQYTKDILYTALHREVGKREMQILAYNLFDGKRMAKILEKSAREEKGIDMVNKHISSMYGINDDKITDVVRTLIIQSILEMKGESQVAKRYGNMELLERRVLS